MNIYAMLTISLNSEARGFHTASSKYDMEVGAASVCGEDNVEVVYMRMNLVREEYRQRVW